MGTHIPRQRTILCPLLFSIPVFWLVVLLSFRDALISSLVSGRPFLATPPTAKRVPTQCRPPTAPGSFGFEHVTVASIAACKDNQQRFRNRMRSLLDIIVTQYTAWHKQQIALSRTNRTHAQTVPKLVYRSSDYNVAIGDVLRGLLHSYLCAVASQRLFLIDLVRPFPISTVLKNPPGYNFTYDPHLFATPPRIASKKTVNLTRLTHFDELDLFLRPNLLTIIDKTQTALDWDLFLQLPQLYPDLPISTKLSRIPSFNPTREEVIPFLLKALFRPSPKFRYLANRLALGHGLTAPSPQIPRAPSPQRSLSIHARVGYGVGETADRFRVDHYNYTFEGLAQCMAHMANTMAVDRGMPEPYQFLFSTDTPAFEHVFKLQMRIIDPLATVRTSNWSAVHLAHARERAELQSFLNVYLDVYLLSMGESLLFIRSGFAHAAAWMGGVTDLTGIQLDTCRGVLNGSATVRESLRYAVEHGLGYHRHRYHSVTNAE
eukprot:GFKZ01008590.1.p1 GENE.GFKZ01008590.1~~GFKZ01008590.1.p1  ORF type:complete len:510 (+),score=29.48 GFKZ01008590.1:64-1530(+)